MKHLRTLLVTFSSDIGTAPVSVFRAAIIEKVGRENPLFHHHPGDDKNIYKYPLILWRRKQRAAKAPQDNKQVWIVEDFNPKKGTCLAGNGIIPEN